MKYSSTMSVTTIGMRGLLASVFLWQLLFIFPSNGLWAAEIPAEPVSSSLSSEDGPHAHGHFDWGLSLYGASAISGVLQNIINFRLPSFKPYYLISLSISRTLWKSPGSLQLEAEIVAAKLLEREGPYQINPSLVIRFLNLPWDRHLPSSFAIGNGLSYASRYATVEIDENLSQRLMYYISLEFAFAAPFRIFWSKPVDILLRVHHRSGMFGVFGDASGGTNYLGLGLRYLL